MRQSILLFIFVLSIIISSCKGQTSTPDISLEDLTFSSIFGDNKKDSLHTYCLLGSGYFRTPRSINADSLLNVWLTQHPNAKVVPVASHGPTMTDYPNSKMTYCWLVDGKDTINNFLVRNGCYPGGTMMRPERWEEMSRQMKEIYKDMEKPKINIHIDKKSYDTFLEQIKAAETFAEQNKLGIWNNKLDKE